MDEWLDRAEKEYKGTSKTIDDPSIIRAADIFNDRKQSTLKNSLDYGLKQNPDAYAQTKKSANTLNVTPDLAQRNPDEVNSITTRQSIQDKLENTEYVKKAFENPDFAAIAHDDVDGLTKLENTVKALGAGAVQATMGLSESIWRTPEALGRVSDAINQGLGINKLSSYLRDMGAPGWLVGTKNPSLEILSKGLDVGDTHLQGTSDIADKIGESTEILGKEFDTFRRINEKGQAADLAFTEALKGNLSPLTDVVTDSEAWAGFIGQAAPSLYTAYKSGGSIPFIAWMESMEVANDAADFEKRTGQRIDPAQFTQAMSQVALINSFLEKFGLDKVFGQAGKGKLTGFIKGAMSEGGTEALQQFNTNVSQYLTYDPEKKLTEGILGSAMGGFGTGGPAGVISVIGVASGPNSEFAQKLTKSQKALNDQEKLNAAVEAVQDVKLKTRDPETVKTFIDDILGVEDEVLIPAEDADIFFQSHVDVLKNLPTEVIENIQESIVTGADVAIAKSDYLTYLSDFHEELSDSLRNDMDGMTAKEASEWVEKGNEEFTAEAERILAEQEMESEFRTQAENVAQTIKDQIVQTGRFNEDVAEKYAQLHKAFAISVADKLNITPNQVYEQFGLKVRGAPVVGEALEQPIEEIIAKPEIREAIQKSAVSEEEKTINIPDGERTSLRTSIADSLYDEGAKTKNNEIWLILGPPGSGKSTVSDPLASEYGAMVIDSDMAKEQLPEYEGGIGANKVHDESKIIINDMLQRAISAGDNIIYPVVGKDYEKLTKSIDNFRNLGYKVNVRLVDVSANESINRAISRFYDTGRFVPPDYILNEVQQKPSENYLRLLDEGVIDETEAEAFSNEVPIGQEPEKLDREGLRDLLSKRQVPQLVRGRRPTGVVAEPEALAQEARGQIQFPEDGAVITLLENADLSTFLHESGHFFLEAYKELAPQNPEIAKDMQSLLDFIGVKDLEAWNQMSLKQRRDGHEKVARAFEAYLFEGKSPNLEIQTLFHRFREWLLNVYQNLAKLNVQLTDEVRQVFDRMLATREQIREKEVARAYDPLFESAEDAGMTEAQWKEYQSMDERQRVVAESDLQTRSLRDMQWLSNAKNKALRALQREANAKRKAIRAEIEEEVSRETIYMAINFLKTGKAVNAQGEEITADQHKLDRDEFVELYPNVKLPRGLTQKEGLPLDLAGEMFGFTSGDELVQTILKAEPEKERISRLTDERMLEKYGDLVDPVAMERAAEEAIHNDAHTRFLHTELTSLSKRTGTRNILSRAAKQYAEESISRKKVKDIKPAQYSAAEARAARNAESSLKKGDRNSAVEHKRAQILNNHFFRAANNAQSEVDMMLRYFKKFDREGVRKNLDPDYRDQIDSQLEKYDLRKAVSLKKIEERKSLLQWVESQEEQGFSPVIDERLLSDAKRQHYKDTPLEELRGLRDSIKNIEHLARLKTKLLRAKKAREIEAAANEISASVYNYASGKNKIRIESNTWLDRARKGKEEFFAMHRKFASLARQMDGFKEGPMWDYFIRSMNESGDMEAVEREKATMILHDLFSPLLKEGKLRQKKFIPEINTSLSREGRISVALNWGNESNRQRIMDGEGWGQDQVQAVLDTLSKEEWDFVQSIWDYIDSYWADIAAKEKRVSGVEPEKVNPLPVFTKYGEYKGGYFPIKYDPERSTRAEQDSLAEITKQAMNGLYTRATTRRGHTKSRVERVNRPVRKDFGVIFEHVDQVIHDLSWHEWLIDANRLLRNKQVDNAIRESYGPEVLKTIRKAIDDIAAGDVPAQNAFERSVNHLRTGVSIAGMGWNLWTSLLQPLGLSQSMVRVGPKWIGKGLSQWLGNAVKMEKTIEHIYEKSDFMRLRGKTLQREINEIRNKVSDGGKLPYVTDSFFYLIVKAQMVADVPTWLGAYEKAIHEGNLEDAAVSMANQAVLDSQGGGQIKDLAQIQRGSPLLKLWTNFYSYFNTTFNLTAESFRRTDFRDPAKVGRFAVDMMLLYTVPATISALMREVLKGKCNGDEDCLTEEIVRENLSYMAGTMVGVREVSSFMGGYYGYSGPAGTRFFSEVSKLGRQIEQGEADAALWKALNNSGGILFHYPAGQVQRTIEGIIAIEEGQVEGPRAITAPLVGPPK